MGFHNGSVAYPQERYLSETIALTAALLLGRKHIFADYLTTGRRRVIVAIFIVYQLLIVATVIGGEWLLRQGGVRDIPAKLIALSVLLPSTLTLVAGTRVVLRRFDAARSNARSWPTEPAHDGVYVYDVPLHEDYITHLQAHLRLGVARSWERTVLGRRAPRLRRAHEGTDLQSVYVVHWTWETQIIFEPGLMASAALACFLTANLCWLYFFAAWVCLGHSEEATKHWFEWIGHRQYHDAQAQREAEEERRRAEEAREAEEQRRDFVVEVPGLRPPTAEQALRHLPLELRRLVEGHPPSDGGVAGTSGVARQLKPPAADGPPAEPDLFSN